MAASTSKPKQVQFNTLSDREQDELVDNIVNGTALKKKITPEKFLAVRDEYIANTLSAHGLTEEEFDDPTALGSDEVTQAGSVFDPHWLVGLRILDPFSKRRLTRIFKPRQIGVITNGQTADPSSFDGRGTYWRPFDAEVLDGGSLKLFRPRLAFIQGWGSGGNQLYGTVAVTHYRVKHGITWLAMRRIVPSSDPSINQSGLDDIIYEEMLRNVRWISMAVGSWDGTGQFLVDPQGDVPELESAYMVHLNDNGQYRRRVYSSSTIQSWQREILQQRASVTPDKESERVDTVSPQEAERRYYQLVMALHMAIASDTQFAELVMTDPTGRVLASERLPRGQDQLKYLPNYNPGASMATMSRNQRALNISREFTF